MSGSRKDIIIEYVNLIAEAFHHCVSYKMPAASIPALAEASDQGKPPELLFKLRAIRASSDDDQLLSELHRTLDRILSGSSKEMVISSLSVLITWMDQTMSYDEDPGRHRFSARALLEDFDTKVVELFSLNTNYEVTGIQIGPKFPVLGCGSNPVVLGTGDSKANPAANRDAFSMLNGGLHNVTVIRIDPSVRYVHRILPKYWFEKSLLRKTLNIAFAPMTDDPESLVINHGRTTTGGFAYHSLEVKDVNKPKELLGRMKRDRCDASISAEADIIVYPEVLGSNQSEETITLPNGEEHNLFVGLQASLFTQQRIPPPPITILPSISRNGINEASIVDQDGRVIAHQKKYTPFISRSEKAVEHLQEFDQREYIILHIPEVHRIAVLICSDFLQICQKGPRSIFEEACVTLVLVPSFSGGESDFMKLMTCLKPYGTSVVWGNCCGASVKPLKRIGAYSSIDTLTAPDFKSVSKCDGTCAGIKSCVFTTSLPLKTSFESGTEYSSVCHFIEKSDNSEV